jgi:GTP-binding protein Era
MVETRCGFVAIIGPPNAGKSTLLNQLVGSKVAIVSPKVQTTRSRITGIAVKGDTQMVFIDTPGIFPPKKRLDRAMVHAAWEGVKEADAVALIVDVSRANPMNYVRDIIEKLKTGKKPAVLILNKVDQTRKDKLLVEATKFNEAFSFEKIFMISASENDGVAELANYFASAMPEGPWHYAEDDMTTMPLRLMAAEVTREKIFLQLHQELPYSCTVETETFDESNPEKWVIEQTIYVERESQRAIILGHKGQQLKNIGMAARKDLKSQFGVPVHLALFVKVRGDWQEDPERYRPWGLEYKA